MNNKKREKKGGIEKGTLCNLDEKPFRLMKIKNKWGEKRKRRKKRICEIGLRNGEQLLENFL